MYVAGDVDEIGRLFQRIERYVKRISADEDILNFNDYRKDSRGGLNKTGNQNIGDALGMSNGRRGV